MAWAIKHIQYTYQYENGKPQTAIFFGRLSRPAGVQASACAARRLLCADLSQLGKWQKDLGGSENPQRSERAGVSESTRHGYWPGGVALVATPGNVLDYYFPLLIA